MQQAGAITRHLTYLRGQNLRQAAHAVFFQCFPNQNVGNDKNHSSCHGVLGV